MSNHYNEWKTKKEVDKLEEIVMLNQLRLVS